MSNFEAHHNFAQITARKARYVADLVRGKDVNGALDILNFTHKRGSFFMIRVLRSAIANATQDGKVNANRLYIRELQVDSGPLLQGRLRYNPGPMGRALPIRKRTSHIHVILAERAEAGGKKAARRKAAATETSETAVAAVATKKAKAKTPAKSAKT